MKSSGFVIIAPIEQMKRLVAIHIRYLNMHLLLLAIVGIADTNHNLVQNASKIMLEIY